MIVAALAPRFHEELVARFLNNVSPCRFAEFSHRLGTSSFDAELSRAGPVRVERILDLLSVATTQSLSSWHKLWDCFRSRSDGLTTGLLPSSALLWPPLLAFRKPEDMTSAYCLF